MGLLRYGLVLAGIVAIGACSGAQEVRIGDEESARTISVDADDPEATGSGGTDVFRFRAVAPGRTTVTLTRTFP